MNATEDNTTKPAAARKCEYPGCPARSSGKSARFCARHRKLVRLKARSKISNSKNEELQALEAEAAPPAAPDPEVRTSDSPRLIDEEEFCPKRASYIDEFIARIRGNRT
jgi:hypothetical protein